MTEYQGPNQHPRFSVWQRLGFWWMSRKETRR